MTADSTPETCQGCGKAFKLCGCYGKREYHWTTQSLASDLGINDKTLLRKIKALEIGIDTGRGFRFSDSDRAHLIESMRRSTPITPRRRRRAA